MSQTIDCQVDAGFARWIGRLDGTVLVTTYQARKIVLVGHDGRQVSVLVRDMEVPMGLAVDGNHLAVAQLDNVVVFADAPRLAPDLPGHSQGKHEHLYLPRVSYATGDIRAHELAFGRDGLWIVNTRFSCLCLSGLAMEDGLPVGERGDGLVCGIAVVDTHSGKIEGMLRFTSGCEEIFDVGLLPGKRGVHLLDPSKPEGRLALSTPDFAYWVLPKEEKSGPS